MGRSFSGARLDRPDPICRSNMQVARLGHASTSAAGADARGSAPSTLPAPAWHRVSPQTLLHSTFTPSQSQITACRCRWVPRLPMHGVCDRVTGVTAVVCTSARLPAPSPHVCLVTDHAAQDRPSVALRCGYPHVRLPSSITGPLSETNVRSIVTCRRPQRLRASRQSVTVRAAGHGGQQYDYDLVIIGCGVGGHGAALHAVECVRA